MVLLGKAFVDRRTATALVCMHSESQNQLDSKLVGICYLLTLQNGSSYTY